MNVESDLFGIASRYLNSAKATGPEELTAICPFHIKADGTPEHNPSFYMNTVTGLWFCHACHEKGNLRTFLRSAGVTPHTIDLLYRPLLESLDTRGARDKTRRCFQITLLDEPLEESTLGLFDYCPTNLLEEGFEEETLRVFDVGFDQRNARITYPIRDLLGRLVGFSGRVIDGYGPKYKVYSKYEYEAWGIKPRKTDKSNFIWNLDKVYPEYFFVKEPEIFLVEGFKACMWLWQMGYKNTVALMGSYMSPEQRDLLQRLGGRIYLFLDNDGAGHRGYNYISKSLSSCLDVSIVKYEGHQPTDLPPDEVHRAIACAPDYYKWVLTGD